MLFATVASMLIALAALHPQVAADAPDRTRPRVRPMDALAQTIVDAGVHSSVSVAQLVSALEDSDVVVYVQTSNGLRARGTLNFLAYGAPLTYVRVRIDPHQTPTDRVATLAHELTHALEIAEASPAVRSEADLAALYRRIGIPGAQHGDFESLRALDNERHAKAEQRTGVPVPPE